MSYQHRYAILYILSDFLADLLKVLVKNIGQYGRPSILGCEPVDGVLVHS